ncbi:hypothetical protein K8I61_02505, partial [bacterium]|nr:hypothetical protein [bacterium]
MTAAPCACCESAAARERVAIAGIAFEKCASCGLLERPADDAKPPAAWPGCDSAEGAFRLLELIGGPGRVALAGRADSRLLA